MDVAEGWRWRLGTEFEPLRRFLQVTDKITSRYQTNEQCDPWRVMEDAGRYVALNTKTHDHRFLQRSDVALHRFDLRRLSSEIADALSIARGFETIGSTQHLFRIGNLPAEYQSRSVWLCVRRTEREIMDAIRDIANHDDGRLLFLHPTGRRLTPRVRQCVRRFDSSVVTLQEMIALDSEHQIVAKSGWGQTLSAALGIESHGQVASYTFQRDDDFWFVAFGGQPRPVRDSSGMPYIAHLLARPNVEIDATLLEALASGIEEVAKSGSRGEQTDKQTLKESNDRLLAIAHELERAEEDYDTVAIHLLQTEREEIRAYVRKAKGLAGNIRDDSDAVRAGDSVSRAVRRAIKWIDKKCPEMAEHLRTNLQTGITLRYCPPKPIDWNF